MLRIGIIGLSEGNGHPYSWSAIFNGFDKTKECPFEVIPEYLGRQSFPKDFLSDLGKVTHIYTQDRNISEKVAEFARIENIVDRPEEMINNIDAVLLARDDAENHYEMALPFLKSGIPVFIDKPFALNLEDANKMLEKQQYDSQIFTCSSLRFAKELFLTSDEFKFTGKIHTVNASIMKKWSTYSIHLLEPMIVNLPNRGRLIEVSRVKNSVHHVVNVSWENTEAILTVTGDQYIPLEFNYLGANGEVKKTFSDTFSCFKSSLLAFVDQINNQKTLINRHETLELINIIEKGLL